MRRQTAMTILTAAALLAVALVAPAQAQPLPSARADLAYSYASVVKRASPAVVNI